MDTLNIENIEEKWETRSVIILGLEHDENTLFEILMWVCNEAECGRNYLHKVIVSDLV